VACLILKSLVYLQWTRPTGLFPDVAAQYNLKQSAQKIQIQPNSLNSLGNILATCNKHILLHSSMVPLNSSLQ
jgi:hypothetical protein